MSQRQEGSASYRHVQRGHFVAIALGMAGLFELGSLARALRTRKPRS